MIIFSQLHLSRKFNLSMSVSVPVRSYFSLFTFSYPFYFFFPLVMVCLSLALFLSRTLNFYAVQKLEKIHQLYHTLKKCFQNINKQFIRWNFHHTTYNDQTCTMSLPSGDTGRENLQSIDSTSFSRQLVKASIERGGGGNFMGKIYREICFMGYFQQHTKILPLTWRSLRSSSWKLPNRGELRIGTQTSSMFFEKLL